MTYDYFGEYYTPTPEKALIVVRNEDTIYKLRHFVSGAVTLVVVGSPIPVNQYDAIFLLFEPTTDKELIWYHGALRPLFGKAQTVVEVGSVRANS